MLNDTAIDYLNRSVLCWLATTDPDGWPNVSPKEAFAVLGRDQLLIANIASPTSVRNIKSNPRVCVSCIDVFVQKGVKIRGLAELVMPDDARYAELLAPLQAILQGAFPIRSIMAIRVQSQEPIIAPSYRLRPDTSEALQIAAAMRAYGVVGAASPADLSPGS